MGAERGSAWVSTNSENRSAKLHAHVKSHTSENRSAAIDEAICEPQDDTNSRKVDFGHSIEVFHNSKTFK